MVFALNSLNNAAGICNIYYFMRNPDLPDKFNGIVVHPRTSCLILNEYNKGYKWNFI